MKKMLVHIRTSIKFILLTIIATFLIVGAVAFFYKPIYSVTIDGQPVGYSANKRELQEKINTYMETGDESSENIAFVQVDEMPQYKLCLLKKGIVANDEEIFEKVKEEGTTYYNYFTIMEGSEEKLYVSDFATAESIVNTLKEKESTNIENISIVEKYETELKEFDTVETAVSKLYVEPVKQEVVVAKTKSSGKVNTSTNISSGSVSLGISLARPISGTITSRFGARSSVRSSAHTGLDIAAPSGTAIGAAAGGTVTFAGRKGSYGNMVVISHGNGVQTYYAHCSKLYVSVGESVSQGETIAAVGSTGNSTGPHLHLEVRVNGVAYNPQKYVY